MSASQPQNFTCPNCHCPYLGKKQTDAAQSLAPDRSAELRISRQKSTINNCHGKMRTLEQDIKNLVSEKESLLALLVGVRKRIADIDLEYDARQREYSACCANVTSAELGYIESLAETPEMYKKLKI